MADMKITKVKTLADSDEYSVTVVYSALVTEDVKLIDVKIDKYVVRFTDIYKSEREFEFLPDKMEALIDDLGKAVLKAKENV